MMYVLIDGEGDIVVESFNNGVNTTGYGNTLEEALQDLRTNSFGYQTIITSEKSEEDLRDNHPELFV